MQRLGGWMAFNRFLEKFPDFELDERKVNPELTTTSGVQNWSVEVVVRINVFWALIDSANDRIIKKVIRDRTVIGNSSQWNDVHPRLTVQVKPCGDYVIEPKT